MQPYHPIPPNQSDAALVVFYRPAIGDPSIYAFPIFDDQTLLGPYLRGTYFYSYVTPGEHTFWMNWAGMKQYLTIKLEGNRTYYVQVTAGQFTLVGESLAIPEVRKLSYVTANRETVVQSMTGQNTLPK